MASRKILVLGSGMVARPCVEYLLRDSKNQITIGENESVHEADGSLSYAYSLSKLCQARYQGMGP